MGYLRFTWVLLCTKICQGSRPSTEEQSLIQTKLPQTPDHGFNLSVQDSEIPTLVQETVIAQTEDDLWVDANEEFLLELYNSPETKNPTEKGQTAIARKDTLSTSGVAADDAEIVVALPATALFFTSYNQVISATVFCVVGSFLFTYLLAVVVRNIPEPLETTSTVARPGGKQAKLDSLDGLRTIFVAHTVLFHLGVLGIAQIGHFPMHLFFVLSGFINVYVSEGRVEQFGVRSGLLAVTRRLARLLPAYQFALLWAIAISFVWPELQKPEPWSAWPQSAMLTRTLYCGPSDVGANGPGWFTMNIMWCSILFPLIFNILPRNAMITAVLLAATLFGRSSPTLLGYGRDFYVSPIFRLLEFVAGMLGARLFAAMPSWSGWSHWGWIFDACLIGMCAGPYAFKIYHPDTRVPHSDFLVTGPCVLLCMAARGAAEAMAKGDVKGFYIGRLAGVFPLLWLAEYSFAAYIVEIPAFRTVWAAFRYFRIFHSPNAARVCQFLASWVAGILVTKLVEKPAATFFEQLLKKKTEKSIENAAQVDAKS